LSRSENFDVAYIIRFLINSGANVNLIDNKGNNALMYSFSYPHVIAKALLSLTDDLKYKNNEGKDILLLAFDRYADDPSSEWDRRFVMLILSQVHRLDLNARDERKHTALLLFYSMFPWETDEEDIHYDDFEDYGFNYKFFEDDIYFLSKIPINEIDYDNFDPIKILINAGADVNAKYTFNGHFEPPSLLDLCLCYRHEEHEYDITVDILALQKRIEEYIILLIKADAKYPENTEQEHLLEQSEDVKKMLSFNYPQYPLRYEFTLNDIRYLSSEKQKAIETFTILRQEKFSAISNELLVIIFAGLLS